MKKSTVLLLALIFVASILVVGFFGMKSLSYRETIYIKSITPTRITLSTDEQKDIVADGDDKYYVRVTYEQGMIVIVDYSVNPANNTFGSKTRIEIVSCTSKTPNAVEIVPERGCTFRINEKCAFTIKVTALDKAGGASFTMEIYTK